MSGLAHRFFFLISIILALALPAASHAAEFVSVHGSSVNIREQPTTRSDAQWQVDRGYPLRVLQRKGQWLKVADFEQTLGWIFAPLTSKKSHRIVTARKANLRTGPGTGYRIVTTLVQHEVVRTLGSRGTWAQVESEDGLKGWLAKSLTWGW